MLRINWWRSLRVQSFVAVITFGFLLVCLFIFYALPEQARWVNEGLSKTAQRSLQQLSTSVTTPLLTRQYAELYEQIDSQLEIQPNWKRIQVIDEVTKNQLYPLDTWQDTIERSDVVLSQQVLFLDKPLAKIILVANFTNEINESSKLHYTLIYSQFTILVIFFMALAWLVDYRITTPLRRLEFAFSKLAKGDFNCHVDRQQKNEIGSVINAFNKMAIEVQSNHQKLNRLRIEAESASKAKSDFMASMSHELRTPLNAILGFAQLYEYDEFANNIQKGNAKSIYRAGEHLLLLINDVLDLTAIESGNMQFNFDYVPIKPLIEDSVELVSELAKAQSMTLYTEGFDLLKGLNFYIDKRRFKQVMLNLLSNAIKYNKRNGEIYISCKILNNQQCEISVADTGCGFANDDISRLFKPFDRLGAETSKVHGTGIGLVITKELVERMQGKISVQSELNKGSCFSLTFNTFEQAGFSSNSDACVIKDKNFSANSLPILDVLVAEDQITNQQVLKQQLTILGVRSTFVSNGEQAWQTLQNKHFDVLLTDIQMPLLDGFELTTRIRKDSRFEPLIIIAITANIVKKNLDDCHKVGMNGFLTKPVELVKLKSLLIKHTKTVVNSEVKTNQKPETATHSFDQLDLSVLRAMLGDDPAVHCMVFNAFLQTAGEQVKLIREYASCDDFTGIAFQAHGLKSSSKSVATIRLADICQEVETLAENKSVQSNLIEELELCFNAVIDQLSRYCQQYENK
ncbi:ATP-binding protein [Pseudoalteromonas sp. 1_2015MBL_MicDiv]|uniref:ATP-binding protein n=1 Tax=Pseudoalteromonas sp. 1_2015MBL_MicDiv TaxID=1720343 RepID=UPI000BBE83B3|nr:ATP-binding protein [Pseudoalteromonas sp. 1_2015MBL_MicDiv]ATG78329.1 histidine kinase [Pseudoalteromonas sp. 1_2015MBL_MicDiv]